MNGCNRRVRILETIRQGKVGGGESHLLSLVKNIDKSIYEPIVLSFTDGPMIDSLREWGIKVHIIPTERPFNPTVWKKVKHLLNDEGIDIVHVHGTRAYSNVVWAAKALSIPIIYTVHGWSFHDSLPKIARKLRIITEKWLVSQADTVISVSPSDQVTGRNHFGQLESTVITNGVDLSKFNPSADYKDIRAEYGISKKVTLLGYIQRVTKQKDPISMIEAFSLILKQEPTVRLLMIGEGELKKAAVDKAKELNVDSFIYFDDFRQDVPDILNAIDIYCLPSLWEGLPIGLLEAMAMEKPVIATQVDGTKEVIESGKNGLMIKPKDREGLANATLLLIKDIC
ncbi:MAG: glycosyltransferase [Cyclobacteriaceae bacterium]